MDNSKETVRQLDWEKEVPGDIKEVLLGTFMKKPSDSGGNRIGGLFREQLSMLYVSKDASPYPVFEFHSAIMENPDNSQFYLFQPCGSEGEEYVPYTLWLMGNSDVRIVFSGSYPDSRVMVDMKLYENPVSEDPEIGMHEKYSVVPIRVVVIDGQNDCRGYIFPENFCDIPVEGGALTEEEFELSVLLDLIAPLREVRATAPVKSMDMVRMEIGNHSDGMGEYTYQMRVPDKGNIDLLIKQFAENAQREQEVALSVVPDSIWMPFAAVFTKNPEEDYGDDDARGLFREELARVDTVRGDHFIPRFDLGVNRKIQDNRVRFFFWPKAESKDGEQYWVSMSRSDSASLHIRINNFCVVLIVKIEKTEYPAEIMNGMIRELNQTLNPFAYEMGGFMEPQAEATPLTIYNAELTGIDIVDSEEGTLFASIESGEDWEKERRNFGNVDFTYEAVLDYLTETVNATKKVEFSEIDESTVEAFGTGEYSDEYSYIMRRINRQVVQEVIDRYSHRDFDIAKKREEESEKPWIQETMYSYIADMYPFELREYAYRINKGNANYKIGSKVLRSTVSELAVVLSARERGSYYSEQKGEVTVAMPNLAFLGEPGTGKTSTAKAIAERLLGAVTYEITGSALQGRYVGHTKPTVIQTFKKLQEEAVERAIRVFVRNNRVDFNPEDGRHVYAVKCIYQRIPKILIVDEAYVLLNKGDGSGYGAEAVETLLEAMAPGRKVMRSDTAVEEGGGTPFLEEITGMTATSVVLDNSVGIWLLGYEKEMRRGLSANKGLYRRVKPILIESPSLKEIKGCFEDKLRVMMRSVPQEVGDESLNIVLKQCAQMTDDYFKWGKSKTYAEFFGNYAGALSFAEEIVKTTLYKKEAVTRADVARIIDKLKHEIRSQYKTVISLKTERAPFVVYTDIEETLKDYIGGRAAKEKLSGVVDMMVNRGDYVGCDRPKGAILSGPPGTGKTFLARCMAGELISRFKKKDSSLAFISVAATELQSPDLIKMLFAESDGYDNVIIFIDEIDAVGRKRETLSNPAMLIQLMAELDGFDGRNNVFVLGATNAPETLDAALVRPGRFDMMLEVDNPDKVTRIELVQAYTKKKFSDQTVEAIADMFAGDSPIEIKTFLNQARIFYYDCEKKLRKLTKDSELQPGFVHRVYRANEDASEFELIEIKDAKVCVAKENSKKINEKLYLKDLRESIAMSEIGERNRKDNRSESFSTERNDESLSSTAIHEVGHALMSVLQGRKFEKITILSRGNMLGYVEHDVNEKSTTRKDLINRIDMSLGGRAAEEIVYGRDNISGGAISDIRSATMLARRMIMELGMNENIGPMALMETQRGYLGASQAYLTSDAIRDEAEREVRQLIKERYAETLQRLLRHADAIKEIAREVYEVEEMSGEDFQKLCEKYISVTM